MSTWIIVALYTLIVLALGVIVWWEYQRFKRRMSAHSRC